MKRVLLVMGTRPEAIKLAPVVSRLNADQRFEPLVCASGQHREMLDQVLALFDIEPAHDLGLMREDQKLSDVAADVLRGIDRVITDTKPDLVMIQGDTTTAMAAALASYHRRIPVAHVEAGLRTGDRFNPFPEEVNRTVIDHLAELCFAPTEVARKHLVVEGIPPQRIHVTGNTVVDALRDITTRLRDHPDGLLDELPAWLRESEWDDGNKRLVVVTLHRRESFGEDLERVCNAIRLIVERNPDVEVVYPVHPNPNVRGTVERVLEGVKNIHLLEPLGYAPFIWLVTRCYMVVTDSGGVQEEVAALGKPALVTRRTTERTEGIDAGAALLIGVETGPIADAAQRLLDDADAYAAMRGATDVYGDGHAADRIVELTYDWLEGVVT